jgi:type II protein arginine methyltransferase
METVPETEDTVLSFCIGQHESNRQLPVSTQAIHYAHASNVRLFYVDYHQLLTVLV